MSNSSAVKTRLWTDEELAFAVNAYLDMLLQQIEGRQFNKAAIARALKLGGLHQRSISSINRRMSNISSVMYDLSMPEVRGYAKMTHVGTAIERRIIDLLNTGGLDRVVPFAPTDDQLKLAQRVSALRKSGIQFMPAGTAVPEQITVTSTSYVRDPAVKAWVLQIARGRCEGCTAIAPFSGVDGLPYLEVHHVMPLSKHGSDRVSNAVALCPNCHSRCHRSLDRDEFRLQLYEQVKRLKVEVPDESVDTTSVFIELD